MKWRMTMTVSLFLGGLLLNANQGALGKGHGDHRRGEPATKHPGANGNARWSADPNRGWVRAEERLEARRPSALSNRSSDKGKQKAKAKGY